MANGKITLDDWKNFDTETRDYHIWSKLEILDTLDDKFASKWVENIMIWAGRIIGGAILLAFIGLIIIQK